MPEDDPLAKYTHLTLEQREEHWRKIREQWDAMPPDPWAAYDEFIGQDKTLAVGPLNRDVPWRYEQPSKERMDELADKLFGPNRIPQLRHIDWDKPI